MATSVTKAGLVAAADKVILAAQPIIEQVSLFTTNFTLDPAKYGDGVAVEVLSATAGDFGADNGYTKSTNSIKPTTVKLNKHKKSTFTIGDIDALENDLSPVWSNLAPIAGRALATQVVKDVFEFFQPPMAKGTFKSDLKTLADFTSVFGQAVKAGIDPADCTLVLTPEHYANLLAALPVSVIGDNEVMRRAVVGAFLGFKAVICQAGDGAFDMVVPTGAVVAAARVIYPVREGGNLVEFGTIQDEKTGFGFGQRVVVDADQGTCSWTVDVLYGVSEMTEKNLPGWYAIDPVS